MTSNAGARDMDRDVIGFGDRTLDRQSKSTDAVNRLFSPEFRNRLDATITFRPLDPEIMKRIVDKNIDELRRQLRQKKAEITISDATRNRFAQRGFDHRFGARPLARLIQTEVKDVLVLHWRTWKNVNGIPIRQKLSTSICRANWLKLPPGAI